MSNQQQNYSAFGKNMTLNPPPISIEALSIPLSGNMSSFSISSLPISVQQLGTENINNNKEKEKLDNTFNDDSDEGNVQQKTTKRKRKGGSAELSEARRESHKIIEQKRRQKINEKINELRELLNYPDGSQNKANVLQAAVDNIKRLKEVVSTLMNDQKKSQEQMMKLYGENERLRSLLNEKAGNGQNVAPSTPNGMNPNMGLTSLHPSTPNMNLPTMSNFTSLGSINIHAIGKSQMGQPQNIISSNDMGEKKTPNLVNDMISSLINEKTELLNRMPTNTESIPFINNPFSHEENSSLNSSMSGIYAIPMLPTPRGNFPFPGLAPSNGYPIFMPQNAQTQSENNGSNGSENEADGLSRLNQYDTTKSQQ